MSENKVMLRNEFVSKLEKKLMKINKSMQLLIKVDKKLFFNQAGGTGNEYSGMAKLQTSLGHLNARIDIVNKLKANSSNLTKQLEALNKSLDTFGQQFDESIALLPLSLDDKSVTFRYPELDSTGITLVKDLFNATQTMNNEPDETTRQQVYTEARDKLMIYINKMFTDPTIKKELEEKIDKDLKEWLTESDIAYAAKKASSGASGLVRRPSSSTIVPSSPSGSPAGSRSGSPNKGRPESGSWPRP